MRRGRWRRRVISLPAITIGLLLGIALAPIWAPLAVVADLVRGRRPLPTLRVATFVIQALALEVLCMIVAFGLWVYYAGRLASPAARRTHSRMQWWWAGHIAAAGRRSVRLRFETTFDGPLSPGPVIAIGRHASYADAILPALLFGTAQRMELRYVVAIGLAWDPCLDVYGHRLRNHFVDRGNADATDIAAIERLVEDIGEHDAAVIFPEGQFYTPARFGRALRRLRPDEPLIAARAARLRNLLPPRPGGTLAMLRAAPQADVVVIAHVGLERFGSVRDIWRNTPLTSPVLAHTWRHDRATLPTTDDDLVGWLYDQWDIIDRWIDEHRASRTRARVEEEK